MPTGQLTERQQKWSASVRAGLERETGRTLEEWAKLATVCPPGGRRARLAWFRQTHGLGQNHASVILNEAFPPDPATSSSEAVAAALWSKADQRAIFETVRIAALRLPGVVMGQRKAFTAFSRGFQFAAARPHRLGVLLGLALEPAVDVRLSPGGMGVWSERLTSVLVLTAPGGEAESLEALLRAAWERS